jgi:hypothetical protein
MSYRRLGFCRRFAAVAEEILDQVPGPAAARRDQRRLSVALHITGEVPVRYTLRIR